jgi:hypothetical protein
MLLSCTFLDDQDMLKTTGSETPKLEGAEVRHIYYCLLSLSICITFIVLFFLKVSIVVECYLKTISCQQAATS